jgi:hypothetical protein
MHIAPCSTVEVADRQAPRTPQVIAFTLWSAQDTLANMLATDHCWKVVLGGELGDEVAARDVRPRRGGADVSAPVRDLSNGVAVGA